MQPMAASDRIVILAKARISLLFILPIPSAERQ